MKNILSLLKMQLDNKTNLLKMTSPKAMIPALLKVLTVLAAAIAVLWISLARIFNLGFAINAELFCMILLVTQLLSLAFAVGNVINTLYLNRDNEMLICLPVTPNQLFISKLLVIYIKEVAVNAMITLPIFITLGIFSATGVSVYVAGASFYLSLPLFVLLLPIFPIVVAAFLSIPVMSIIKFLKKHTLLAIMVIFSIVCVCLWGYLSAIGSIAGEFNIVEKQIETVLETNNVIATVGKRIPLYYQLGRAMTTFSMWYWFPVFIVACVAVSVAAVLFTRRLFFKMAMSSLENTVKTKTKIKKFRKRSRFATLLRKEVFCVFRSSSEIFEYFLFTILMPFIVFSYSRLLMTLAVDQSGINMIAGAHVMVVAIMAMLSNISSASAVSRDGGNFHTSKTIPVNFFTQMFAKFSFNAIFTIGAIILTAVVSFLAFDYPAWQIVMGSIAVAMAAVGHIAYSISCDIQNPTISAVGDDESSTVSKSTTKCLVAGLLVGFILGMIVILMSGVRNPSLPYWIIIVLSGLYMVNRIVDMILRINCSYHKIEM